MSLNLAIVFMVKEKSKKALLVLNFFAYFSNKLSNLYTQRYSASRRGYGKNLIGIYDLELCSLSLRERIWPLQI